MHNIAASWPVVKGSRPPDPRPEGAPVALLEVENLQTYLYSRRGENHAVDGVSFTLDSGQSLGLVGESGSGKSMTALSILRLVPQPAARIVGGSIRFGGEDLLAKSEAEMQRLRGSEIAIILQDPLTSLNPLFSIGFQVGEAVRFHQHLSGRARLDAVIASLQQVRVASAATRVQDYPHQFSGGMRQRVVGAIAISCKPRLLIADEATTALDVTLEAQILHLLKDLCAERGTAVLFISHDLGVVSQICDRVLVMYAGRAVEEADVYSLFDNPLHPYTRALLASVPTRKHRGERLATIPGRVPSLSAMPEGCKFADRCPYVQQVNRESEPRYIELAGHRVRCNIYDPESGYVGARAEPRPPSEKEAEA
jgi:oligopeptide/dipeptide ABC transporter ATP-binding protein